MESKELHYKVMETKKTGNLWNLLWLANHYNNDVNSYLNSESKTKFMSADIQKEMVKILSQAILRKLIAAIKDESRTFSSSLSSGNTITNGYIFSLIADGGQGYDSASNMAGKINGLQQKMIQ